MLCSSESTAGNATTQLGVRGDGRKNGSEGDKVFPFQKAWAKLCSDAHQWKKIQKRLERGRQSCPLSPTCIWCTAGGRFGDVSVIIPRTGCRCDHPRFVLCSSVMDLALASSCIQTTFTLQIHLMPPEDGPSYCSSCTPLNGACRQHSPSSSTRLSQVWCAGGCLQNTPSQSVYYALMREGGSSLTTQSSTDSIFLIIFPIYLWSYLKVRTRFQICWWKFPLNQNHLSITFWFLQRNLKEHTLGWFLQQNLWYFYTWDCQMACTVL